MSPHEVVLAVVGPVVVLDFAAPMHFFGHVGSPRYRVRVAANSLNECRFTSGTALVPDGGVELLGAADTIVVPGYARAESVAPPPDITTALAAAHRRGARIVSVCTGAFALGHAGLLDGRHVTTHFNLADDLQRQFPSAYVESERLYLGEGNVFTSGGLAAGLDLCIHLLELDMGTAQAAAIARRSVLPLHRRGDQRQFIGPESLARGTGHTEALTDWILQHLREVHTVNDIAEHARLSRRHLSRLFQRDIGLTPSEWLKHARITRARELLESTDLTIEAIANAVGYRSMHTFRMTFRSTIGVAPSEFRAPNGSG